MRRPNTVTVERIEWGYDHAAILADSTVKLWKLPRAFRLDRVMYTNPTGLAVDGANFFNVKIRNLTSAVTMANRTTATDAIVADTPVDLTLSATDSDLVMAQDDVLAVFFDETGDTTLPPGRFVFEGRFL